MKAPRRLPPPRAEAARSAHAEVSTRPAPPTTATEYRTAISALWSRIRTEYITDPENPTLEALAIKYAEHIGKEAIRKRAADEGWHDAREKWWQAAEVKLLEKIQDEYLKERVAEMRTLRRAFDALAECALPLTDKKGTVLRDIETGLPRFALPFRSQEQVLRAMLLVQERSMLLRGEAIMRTESAIKDKQADHVEAEDPTFAALAGRVNFSPNELRSLAREFLRKREEALATLDDEEDESKPDGEL